MEGGTEEEKEKKKGRDERRKTMVTILAPRRLGE